MQHGNMESNRSLCLSALENRLAVNKGEPSMGGKEVKRRKKETVLEEEIKRHAESKVRLPLSGCGF